MIKVVLVDDHAIMRDGIKQILVTTEGITVEGEADSGEEALSLLKGCPCDVLILDITMPGISGVELIQRIGDTFPCIPILVLSMHNDAAVVTRAVKAGAKGYVAKGSKSPVLIDAIRALAEGGTYLDPAVSGFVFTGATGDAGVPTDILTKRELEVLRLIADGISLSDIGDKLHLSPKTVSTHKMRLKQKLGIENNADLIRYAVKHNIKG